MRNKLERKTKILLLQTKRERMPEITIMMENSIKGLMFTFKTPHIKHIGLFPHDRLSCSTSDYRIPMKASI